MWAAASRAFGVAKRPIGNVKHASYIILFAWILIRNRRLLLVGRRVD
jgi:hypothetical protein